jgi:hypothetical protein
MQGLGLMNSGLVLGAITGAFDASSLPLVFFKLAYFSHNGQPSMYVCITHGELTIDGHSSFPTL